MAMIRPNKTLILGNGFDLDLQLPTTYAKFATSQFWPLKDEDLFHSQLAQTLQNAKETERWFDIEDILFRYARDRKLTETEQAGRIFGSVESDKEVYHRLCSALCVYIEVIQSRKPINKESLAAKVLRAISANGTFNKVLSFNYTDLDDICSRVGCAPVPYKHVHGSAKKGAIILGVSDEHRLLSGYDCLYKSQSIHYKSPGVRTTLNESSEIVIFGHSLGLQDIAYFSDFINRSADISQSSEQRRRITFFTKDETSQEQLMKNIRALNPSSFGRFRDLNDVVFVRTEDVDKEDLDEFFEHLDNTSLASQKQMIDGLVRSLE